MKLPKTYEPQQYEPAIYQLWEQAKVFAATKSKTRDHFSIILPPPNANGNLHAGHALTVAIEDVAVRYHRLKGDGTVYLPGADHAGFETWVVFERQLEKEGKSRFDFSREQLYQMVWDFVANHRGNMEIQLRQLGASLDWDNLTFTLDKKVIETAFATFKQMWDDGLVYRGKRLVNYCTTHHTGFADIEVAYEDRVTPLYYMKYGPFTLATTRPETKFGDTGVAVHPSDERYKQYIGKELEIEGVNGPFTVTVVADELVDPAFGTGVVKVTPAHSFDDWEIGERHNLPAISVIDQDGKMTEKAGRFAGMTVLEAREAVVKALEEKGLLVKVDAHYKNRVGLCYKCKTVIEPMLMDQWFVKVKPLAEKAIKAVESGAITFYPASKAKVLVNYYKNLRDWNISRQIPWGIPVPAFQSTKDPDDWIFDTRVDQTTIEVNGTTYTRDPDTFDTWFSSGQWPYITTDYLTKSDLAKFYPNSVMETGYDILFAWVSRMIMFGLYRTNQLPFKTVYLHGMVVDQYGQKMSKSKGNVLNPMELVAEYGSDATRMGFLANRTPGVNQPYQPATMIAGRNFANKLWNIARFIEDKLGDNYKDREPQPQTIADHWVIQQLNKASREVGELIESYRFAEAYEVMYHAIWDDVADWYIESSKNNNTNSVLAYVLETILTLAHPFAPFVTETIWQTLKWEDSILAAGSWPQHATFDAAKAVEFSTLQNLVSEVRFLSAQLVKGKLTLLVKDDTLVKNNEKLVQHLAQLKAIEHVKQGSGLRLAVAKHEAWLDIDAKTLQEHREKLEERLASARENIARLEVRLTNKAYVDQAPSKVVQQTKDQLQEQRTLAERLEREMNSVSA
ncbi:MAG TPA: valine--tRNA ligase [Magnetospirillaceae bacterium]|nr:valine--tRNA ligase [Magnetospirillaceae bacterium]